MKKIPYPTKNARRIELVKPGVIASPLNLKKVLRVSRHGEIYIETGKIFIRSYKAKYPRVIAKIDEFMGEKVLYIKDKPGSTESGYRFNSFVMENTRYKHVLFEKDKEFFMLPVERIINSGRPDYYTVSGNEPSIDQRLYLPYVLFKMYLVPTPPK